ncbi:MAG: hypothetical protein ACRCWM_05105 [Sarcina sp.]
MNRLYNMLVGFTISFGKVMFALFIIAMIFDKSLMNYENTLFIFIMTLVGWCTGFIYDFDINKFVRFLVHSMLLYGTGLVSYYLIYGAQVFKESYILASVIYWVCYLIFYIAAIYYIRKIDVDLNDAVEFIKKDHARYVRWGEKDE